MANSLSHIIKPRRVGLSVVVPSYGRSSDLARCLVSLGEQSRLADEVVVVARRDDAETLAVAGEAQERLPGLRIVRVERPGMVAALNAGAQAAEGDIIAITDDDARPEPGWLKRIGEVFDEDGRIGAVGGPDIVAGAEDERAGSAPVGRVTWYGRILGNHHASRRRADVQILKGVNMAYRASALTGFDERLRGSGAQVGNDMEASLSVWRRGYRVVFDPAVRVRHYPARRAVGDERMTRSARQLRDEHHNETYISLTSLPPARALVCTAYAFLIGYRSAPGIGHLVLRLISGAGRKHAWSDYTAVTRGRVAGVATTLQRLRCKVMATPRRALEEGTVTP